MPRWLQRLRDMRRRRALWSAIHLAAGNRHRPRYLEKVHPINGLRVIKCFEEVNGFEFDPLNSLHRQRIADRRPLIALWHLQKGLRDLRWEEGQHS